MRNAASTSYVATDAHQHSATYQPDGFHLVGLLLTWRRSHTPARGLQHVEIGQCSCICVGIAYAFCLDWSLQMLTAPSWVTLDYPPTFHPVGGDRGVQVHDIAAI